MKYILFDYKIVIVAFSFIILDILTGLIAAWVTGTFESRIMRDGGRHKVMLLCTITLGIAMDYAQAFVNIGISVPATMAICGYITLMEILSCVENINKGFPQALPKSIVSLIKTAAKEHEVDVGEEE